MKAQFFSRLSNPFRTVSRLSLAALSLLVITACMFDGSEGIPANQPTGYVQFDLRLTRTDKPLGKSAAADTTFELDSVLVVLSASGAASQSYSYPVSGRSDLASLPVSLPAFPLAALRNWKAVIYSIDTTLNPTRRDTVHIDSVFFGVQAGDTADVVKTVSPAFSILRARFVSNQADSIGTGMRFVRLRVNGVTRDSLDMSTLASNLNAVHFATTSVGYAAGDGGELRKTTNGGGDWTQLASGTTENLKTVWFTSATNGWIGGEGGLIRKTTDGGSNWTTQASGTAHSINRFYFANSSNGWAFGDGGTMLRTVNGGANWAALSGWGLMASGTTTSLRGIDFIDANTGYVVGGSGLIRKTTDGGLTWTAQNSGTGAVLNAVSVSGSYGLAVGSGGVITYTLNGGGAWTDLTVGSTAWYAAYNNGTRAWIAGDNGSVRYSTNGTTWTAATNTGSTNYRGVFFRNNNLGWVVGSQGVIRKTTSSTYTSWTQQGAGVTAQTLNAVWFVSDTHGWAVGNAGVVLRTTNGGTNWLLSAAGSQTLTGVWFASTSVGYASGHGGAIYKSVNGGANWTLQSSGTSENLHAIHGVSATEIWAAGEDGAVTRTTSGGAPVTAQNLNGAYFRNDTGYVVGDAGTALRTIDGGDSWIAMTGGSANNLNGVFSTGNYAYIVGDAGTIRTVPHDGETNALTARTSNTTDDLYAVWGSPTVGSTRMYAVGADGDIRYITSATSAWTALTSNTTETLRGIQCSGGSVACWAVGANESIVKSVNGTSWTVQGGGVRAFDEMLAYKYLKPGTPTTVVLQAIDRVSPLRGYQATLSLNVGAGIDSTVNTGLTRCGYGGGTPACAP